MSRKPKEKNALSHAFPDHLKDFMTTIEIKEDLDDPKERARRAKAKRKQKEAEEAAAKQRTTNKFTDEDIRGVVKSFKMNFPQGFHIKVSETGISD